MSALAKIKKAAVQHEQDRQYDKALAQYARLLDGGADTDEDVDVTLYNRAGDLALRAGDVPRAVTYFERAIDLYAAGGFLNNAVALAVKILRHAPGHLAAHHTLGVLYGRKGFRAEARQHLADYAAQMHRAGRGDEVRRTLTELAALGSTPDEVAAVRELLTARAATPDDAGALVKAFAVAAGADVAADGRQSAAASGAVASAAIPLSELIEFEIRGPRFAPAPVDGSAGAIRWISALPGERAPLLISALRAQTRADEFDLLDAPTIDHPPTIEPSSGELELFDMGAFDVPALDAPALDAPALDAPVLNAPALDSAMFDTFAFETLATDAAMFELSPFDVTTAVPRFEMAPPETTDVESIGLDIPVIDATAAVALPLRADTGPVPSGPGLPMPDDGEPTDLGAWLRSTELPVSTRLVTPAPRETGDESADFDAALHAFTTGIAHSVDAGDRESHYDLGVAFREMGLLTDAVREFQRALASPGSGMREREALAQSFLDLARPELALVTLEDAAADAVADGAPADMLVGVHYVLAEAARAVGRTDAARGWYVRVLATDYDFRDAATHLAALPPPATRAGSP